MRAARLTPWVTVAVATLALCVPAGAGASAVSATLNLNAGVCTTTTCLFVGTDSSNHGAIVPARQDASTGISSSCSGDSQTVGIAVAAYEAENPTSTPTTPAKWKAALLGDKNNGPFLQYWPNEHASDYVIEVAGNAFGRTTGDHVKAENGDVIVTAVRNDDRTYDATVNPTTACGHLNDLVLTAGAESSDASTGPITGVACPAGKATCYGVTQNLSPSEGGIVVINVRTPADPTVSATDAVASTTSLSAIACPSAAECIAVGSGPSSQGVVVPISDGTVGSPVTAADERLEGVACSSSALCVAVGTDLAASKGVIVPIHLSGSLPTFGTPVDVPSTAGLMGTACAAAGHCVAVGEQIGAGSVATGVVVRFQDAAGTPTAGAVQPARGTSELLAVACIGAGACEATGLRSGSPGHGVAAGISDGTITGARAIAGTSSVHGIACSGATVCFGLGTGSGAGVFEQLSPSIVTRSSLRTSASHTRTRRRIAFTALVSPTPASGTVMFTSDGTTIDACAAVQVRAGVARCGDTFARGGTYVVRAIYSGDADELRSSSRPVIERVSG